MIERVRVRVRIIVHGVGTFVVIVDSLWLIHYDVFGLVVGHVNDVIVGRGDLNDPVVT